VTKKNEGEVENAREDQKETGGGTACRSTGNVGKIGVFRNWGVRKLELLSFWQGLKSNSGVVPRLVGEQRCFLSRSMF
jgi:hypothetical protein